MNQSIISPAEERGRLPIIRKLTSSSFLLIISQTQLNKSTINANSTIRECFLEGGLIDFDKIEPGQKKIMPCKIYISGKTIETKVSLLIPKRRGETQPEPRFWPYKLAEFVEGGTELYFTISEGSLEVRDSLD